jgi:hypothetical protein
VECFRGITASTKPRTLTHRVADYVIPFVLEPAV